MSDEQTTERDEEQDEGRDEQEAQEGSGADDGEEARSSGDQDEDSGDSSASSDSSDEDDKDDGDKSDKEKQDEEIEAAKEEVKGLEGDPPEDLEDWPSGKAQYETFGGPEGDHGYHEGAEEDLGPSSLRHHEDGTRDRRGRGGRRPRRVQGQADPGGPTDPDTANLRSDKAEPRGLLSRKPGRGRRATGDSESDNDRRTKDSERRCRVDGSDDDGRLRVHRVERRVRRRLGDDRPRRTTTSAGVSAQTAVGGRSRIAWPPRPTGAEAASAPCSAT